MLELRIHTPPTAIQYTPSATTKPDKELQLPLATTNTMENIPMPLSNVVQPEITTEKRSASSRIDSGFGQKRPGDTEKPLPALGPNKSTVGDDGKDKRNSSAAELADWLALSKMMDTL
jgi:hypothetical protein